MTWEITTANNSLEFDTVYAAGNSCYPIDDNHFIHFWGGSDSDGFVQVFEVNTSTRAVTTANDSLEFDTTYGTHDATYIIDSNHFINFWYGIDGDGFVQVFEVNTSTWAITTANDSLEFDTEFAINNSCYIIDTNHFINFWAGLDSDGYAQVFEVNTSTRAVTTANDSLEYNAANGTHNSCYSIDSNHFINFFAGVNNWGQAQTFEVNTSTRTVTTASDAFTFNGETTSYNNCFKIDDNHFINFFADISSDGQVQTFEVNTSTWAITTVSDKLEFDTVAGTYGSCYSIDSNHFINFRAGNGYDGYTQTFEVNTSTWAVTTASDSLEFDTVNSIFNSCYIVDSSHFINFWGGSDSDGYVQIFEVNIPVVPTTDIKTIDGLAYASIKTIDGLAIDNMKTFNGLE